MRRVATLAAGVLVTVLGAGCTTTPATDAPDVVGASGLRVTTLVSGLDIPWDVQPLPGGRILITERARARLLVWRDGTLTTLAGFPSSSVWPSGEAGLMSLEVDPAFATNRRIYTCQAATTPTGHDVRILAWRMNQAYTRVGLVRVLLRGLPATTGRHSGCRLLILRNGALLVGTGDAADHRNAQSLRSLGGKTLRLNRMTGAPWPTNPWPDAANLHRRYVFTWGHRNVQGLAQRADGSVWSVEHGPDRNDEVNRLSAGGNYGWNPGPGYDESRPMTDVSLPGHQIPARWSSGVPTLATSGATWVRGTQWGDLNGTLAIACLKASRVVFMKFDAAGRLRWTRAPAALQQFGRLRSISQAPGGDLLVTTSNGTRDAVLRVHPTG